MKNTRADLAKLQSKTLDEKIEMSVALIETWLDVFDGKAFVSFSGGLDSTVLLHLARTVYPHIPGVCADALLYPEIKQFVASTSNTHFVKPRKSFYRVTQEYGYPVVSRRVATGIDRCYSGDETQIRLRLHGGINPTSGKKQRQDVPRKWHYLLDAPFKVSDKCCYWLKKAPLRRAYKDFGAPMIGTRASEGMMRTRLWLKYGCSIYKSSEPKSAPLSFWTDLDIREYIRQVNIPYCEIYDMGYKRTGCFACMFGVHMENIPNRFQRMQETHPKLWRACQKWGIPEVLDYINVPYGKYYKQMELDLG